MVRSSKAQTFLFALLLTAGSAAAQVTGPVPEESLNKIENKMFSRAYGHDPVEKRLERLELMVFGGVQMGGLGERWQRIVNALADREKENLASKTAPGQAQPPGPGRYPAVDSLEWRILKKTYREEAIGDRLSRLETKLLGQPNPALSHSDRVERLKKMVTAGDMAKSGTAMMQRSPLLGPMPRALPRMTPGGSPPYISPFSMDPNNPDEMNKMLTDMFEQMNKQMQDLRNLPPGSYTFKFGPNGMPILPGMPGMPRRNGIPDIFTQPPGHIPLAPPTKRPPEADLPPYADPNSI